MIYRYILVTFGYDLIGLVQNRKSWIEMLDDIMCVRSSERF
jgi:hypothetical protein